MKHMKVTELQSLLHSGAKPLLIDVRESHELINGVIEGAISVPMNTIPERLDEFSDYKEQPVVLICRSGKRSVQVGLFMEQAGFTDIINLEGGMNEWASQIDNSMTVY